MYDDKRRLVEREQPREQRSSGVDCEPECVDRSGGVRFCPLPDATGGVGLPRPARWGVGLPQGRPTIWDAEGLWSTSRVLRRSRAQVPARKLATEQDAQAGAARPLAIASVREQEERQLGSAPDAEKRSISGRAFSGTVGEQWPRANDPRAAAQRTPTFLATPAPRLLGRTKAVIPTVDTCQTMQTPPVEGRAATRPDSSRSADPARSFTITPRDLHTVSKSFRRIPLRLFDRARSEPR